MTKYPGNIWTHVPHNIPGWAISLIDVGIANALIAGVYFWKATQMGDTKSTCYGDDTRLQY